MTQKTFVTKELVISHCRWIATWDRAEAIRAFNWYAQMLPWLNLRDKNAPHV